MTVHGVLPGPLPVVHRGKNAPSDVLAVEKRRELAGVRVLVVGDGEIEFVAFIRQIDLVDSDDLQ